MRALPADPRILQISTLYPPPEPGALTVAWRPSGTTTECRTATFGFASRGVTGPGDDDGQLSESWSQSAETMLLAPSRATSPRPAGAC